MGGFIENTAKITEEITFWQKSRDKEFENIICLRIFTRCDLIRNIYVNFLCCVCRERYDWYQVEYKKDKDV